MRKTLMMHDDYALKYFQTPTAALHVVSYRVWLEREKLEGCHCAARQGSFMVVAVIEQPLRDSLHSIVCALQVVLVATKEQFCKYSIN